MYFLWEKIRVFHFRQKEKNRAPLMLKRKKTEHIRGGVIRLKTPKNQFIANLEQENFIFRKMFCNFAGEKL